MSHAEAMRSHPFDTTLNQRCVSHRVLPSDSYVRSTANAETHGDRTFPASSGTSFANRGKLRQYPIGKPD